MNPSLTARQQQAVRLGAGLARALWLACLATVTAAIAAGWAARFHRVAGGVPWTAVSCVVWGAMAACGCLALVFVPVCLAVRCPGCGARLIPNPFGRAPRSFELHPSCGRFPGIERWRRQADRIRRQRRCLCLGCGEDFDLARRPADD